MFAIMRASRALRNRPAGTVITGLLPAPDKRGLADRFTGNYLGKAAHKEKPMRARTLWNGLLAGFVVCGALLSSASAQNTSGKGDAIAIFAGGCFWCV